MSSKYKNFWVTCIGDIGKGTDSFLTSGPWTSHDPMEPIHLIEHAAYLELKGKLDTSFEIVKTSQEQQLEIIREMRTVKRKYDKVLEALKDVIRNSSDIVAKKRCSNVLSEIEREV